MRARKKIFIVLAGTLVVALAAILFHITKAEPMYGGRSFDSWFREAEKVPYIEANGTPEKAILAMGSNAVPLLAARVRPAPWWLKFYWSRYPKLSQRLQRSLPPPESELLRQNNAANLLEEFGPVARAAEPALIDAYRAEYARLYHLSPANIDWMAQFTNPPPATSLKYTAQVVDGVLRMRLIPALAHSGGDNKETVPLLFAATHDADGAIKGLAIYVLTYGTNLAKSAAQSEPIVRIALTDDVPAIRAAAASVLGLIVSNNPDLIPPLMIAAQDSDRLVQDMALRSLQKSKPDLKTLLPVLSQFADNTNIMIRHAVARSLIRSQGGSNMVAEVSDLLETKDSRRRFDAVRAIGCFGPRAQSAVPKLQELTNAAVESDESIRHAAATSLNWIAPDKFPP